MKPGGRVAALINFYFQTPAWQTPRADCVHFSLIPKTQINNAGSTWLTAVFLELAEELAFFVLFPKMCPVVWRINFNL